MYENQRGQLMNQQFNVEQTSFALQSMQDSVQTVQAMKVAGKELKQAFKQPELNINDIENLQDQMADMMVRWLFATLTHAIIGLCVMASRRLTLSHVLLRSSFVHSQDDASFTVAACKRDPHFAQPG